MIFERVALVGDAANAIALMDALQEHEHNVLDAFKAWELNQLALRMHLWKRGRDLKETSQFVFGKKR